MFRVTGIDHIVLRVADIDRSLAFYHGLLGLAVERLDQFRAGEIGFPSVRVDERFVIDLFPRAADDAGNGHNLDHFCRVVEASDLAPLIATLAQQGIPVEQAPRTRWGAQGTTMSIYLRDPDGNRLELRTYAPAARAEAERLLAQPVQQVGAASGKATVE